MLYSHTLVAEDFAVPETVETSRYRLRQLTVADLDLDFEAVTSSEDHLRGVFGARNTWPAGLTRERDLADLGWHETEFDLRTSFAYTVMSLDESLCLGCVYIYPSRAPAYEAFCTMWVRASVVADGLDVASRTLRMAVCVFGLSDAVPFRIPEPMSAARLFDSVFLGQSTVEPYRRVERPHLVNKEVREFSFERRRIFLGVEIPAEVHACLPDSSGYPENDLAHRGFVFGVGHAPLSEVLRGDDISRQL